MFDGLSLSKRLWALVFFGAVIALLSCCIYVAFLPSGFQLDDLPNFYGLSFVHDKASALAFVVEGPAGLRWISYASYLLHVDAWKAGDAFPFKLVNLLIHALNALLVFFTIKMLLQRSQLFSSPAVVSAGLISVFALLSAVLWFAHPVHVNTVLYAVQRMTLLAATFTLLGFLWHFYYLARCKNTQLSVVQWFIYSAVLALITALGVLGKENAILLPALCLLLAIYSGELRRFKAWQWSLTYLAPFILLVAYLIYSHRLGFGGRDFTMAERLLSQVVILKEYLFKLLIPNAFSFSLYYDGWLPVRSVVDGRFISSGVFWLCAITLSIALRKIAPALLFGLLWFFVAHSLEGSIIPLELYFDHRNYLPSIGIVLALVLIFYQLIIYLYQQGKKFAAYALLTLAVLLAANTLWVQYGDAALWQDKATYEQGQMLKRPDSLRAKQGYIETLFAKGELAQAIQALEFINQQFGVSATHVIYQVIAACLAGADDNIDHARILTDLPTMPLDKSADSALQSLYDMVTKEECQSIDSDKFHQYAYALLANPHMRMHYHNFALLLVQSYLQQNEIQQALDASFVLAENQRSQQYWFMQLNMAIALAHKEQAQTLYDAMLQSKKVHKRLYAEQIALFKEKIDAL